MTTTRTPRRIPLVTYHGPSKPATLYGTRHSMSSLARKSGLSVSFVSLVFRRRVGASDATIAKFAAVLRVPRAKLTAALRARNGARP